ncbi:MAG: hypothetical protein WKF30_13175 [Pyrinomonadaceae bacterium]
MVTHDPRYARYADRTFHLFDGQVVEEDRSSAEAERKAASALTSSGNRYELFNKEWRAECGSSGEYEESELSLRGLRRRLDAPRNRAFVVLAFFCALLGLMLTGSRVAYLDQLSARADLCVAVFVLALTIGLYAALSGRLVSFIRRKSLVAAYDERAIVFDLGQAARAATGIDQLYKIVVDRLGEALAVDRVALFVAEPVTGNYVRRVIMGSELPPPAVTLARDAFVIKRLRNLSAPFGFGPNDLATWERAFSAAHCVLSEARRRECDALRDLDARLLLQITIKDQLVGFLSLGPRRGGVILRGRQTNANVRGRAARVCDRERKAGRADGADERLTRELALAGGVQQQLFPAAAPQSLFIDAAGFCQPAREVGGDYYDFLRFDHGHVGVAIADVAGKGISAALLMSGLQASLRSIRQFKARRCACRARSRN